MSSSFHSSIDENEERKNVSYNHRILTASLLIKGHVIFAWQKEKGLTLICKFTIQFVP